MAGSVTYSLVFQNNSVNAGSAAVYQTDPNIGVPNVMSLAWFSKYAMPTTNVVFQWSIDYSFVWSQTGTLKPGVVFLASQNWAADLSSSNAVTLTYQNSPQGGAYTFQNQGAGPQQGTLYITEDGTVPLNQASVGIGMSGAGSFVVQAQPNLNLTFTPHPLYWITFGNYFQGQVLDIGSITNPGSIQFPPGVYSMTAILNQNNSWTIQPTQSVNMAFLEAKKREPKTLWACHEV